MKTFLLMIMALVLTMAMVFLFSMLSSVSGSGVDVSVPDAIATPKAGDEAKDYYGDPALFGILFSN